MLTWLRRLFTPPPRLVALVNRLDDLEERYEYLAMELKRLRGRITGAERKEKAEMADEDAPGRTISADDDHSPRALGGSRMRRFRGF